MPAVDNADGVVLLIGSGRRAYREYLLKGAASRCPLWLIDTAPVGWQRPYVVGGTVVPPLDADREVPDLAGLTAAAVELAGQRPVRGVFTYDELLVIAAARIADRLGVPGFGADGAERCRDKHRSRMTLAAAGLRQPRFGLAHTAAEAVQMAESFGYPVVVKPCGMAASIGVVRVDDRAGVAAAFAAAELASHSGPPAYEGRALVEELVLGPEFSVDGAVSHGDYQPFCLARKQVGFDPSFEETGHLVDAADPLLADPELRRVLAGAHRALGLRDGITHSELRLTPDGPVVIEINARLGGDLIPYLGQLATGLDPGRIAAEVALGHRPRIEPTRRAIAGIRFLYPPEDCRVREVVLPRPGAVPGLVEAGAMAAPGGKLRLPPRAALGRYAYLVCTADSLASCQARLDDAAKLADIHYEPLAPATAGERPW
jgi:glutathione synthase/RimK-type ligase-like ATP-grasp enzyme